MELVNIHLSNSRNTYMIKGADKVKLSRIINKVIDYSRRK